MLKHRAAVLEAEFSRLSGEPVYSLEEVRAMLKENTAMGERRITVLSPAWRDIDRIADIHLKLAGPKYAEQITDKLLEVIGSLAVYPYLGPLHPDPVLAQHQYRKLVCGNYVCVYKLYLLSKSKPSLCKRLDSISQQAEAAQKGGFFVVKFENAGGGKGRKI